MPVKKVKKVIQIVALVRETTNAKEILEMKKLVESGGITSLCFYPLRDQHYDEGFSAGELVLLDGDDGKELARVRVNLSKSVIGKFNGVKE